MQPKSPSSVTRKVRCVPPWCRMSPFYTQGAPAHTYMTLFSQSITCPLCSLAGTCLQVCPRRMHARWVSQRPYILPHSKLFSSLTTSIDLHGVFCPISRSHHHSTNYCLPLFSSRKTPLRKLQESMKCHVSLTYCCIHTSTWSAFSCSVCWIPL
jgi:hypothetical protein